LFRNFELRKRKRVRKTKKYKKKKVRFGLRCGGAASGQWRWILGSDVVLGWERTLMREGRDRTEREVTRERRGFV